ncbi:hypothetical protein V8G61_03055 [Gaetbulibacter sp. M240]|uniref:hypothetical protein n=1 Tax=Gaetbulibacter sp. M240 TaxID=3126511 RepID=UPI00374F60EA
MKTFKIKLSLISLFVLSGFFLFGQNTTNTENRVTANGDSHLSIGLNYINDAVYMGRKDSITAPYIYPTLTYHNKSGFYVTGSLSYLTRSNESRVDLFLGTLGFDFNSDKFSGDISFTKYFFNDDSYNVISEVEADITAMASYDFEILKTSITLITFFNNGGSSDLILNPEIGHDFVSAQGDFQISPAVGVYFSSQNFYEQYYIYNRFGSGRGKGSGTTQTTSSVVLNERENFDLMAIEFSLPIWYVSDPITVYGMPVLVIPQNPATLTIDSTIYEEDLENTFYIVLGVNYKF